VHDLLYGGNNLVHLKAIPNITVERWKNSKHLERRPEMLFHIGQAVKSCQSITTEFWPGANQYNSALVSYLTVGHFGVITIWDGEDPCKDVPAEATTCTGLRGRAIIRLLLRQDNTAALMLEKPYFGSISRDQERVIMKKLLWKAIDLSNEISAPLYTYKKVPEGTAAGWDPCICNEVNTELRSLGGLAPVTYVDSLGGLAPIPCTFTTIAQCQVLNVSCIA
jgi:hypothetical protein